MKTPERLSCKGVLPDLDLQPLAPGNIGGLNLVCGLGGLRGQTLWILPATGEVQLRAASVPHCTAIEGEMYRKMKSIFHILGEECWRHHENCGNSCA